MLQKLNERIQGVVAWVVIILIALTFTLFGVDYYMQSRQSNDIEVTVNDQPITKHFFEVNFRRTRQQRDPAEINAASDIALRKQVLNNLITNLVSIEAAKAGGFEVSPKQADNAILNIPQFQEDGHFSNDRYTQALSGAMFTHESFEKEVKQGMLINQQRFAIVGSSFVLPSELKRFVKLYMQTRNYEYLTIPASLFLQPDTITSEEVKNYYKTHQQDFLTPEKIKLDYVFLSMQQFKKAIKISDEQVKRYYDENQSNFLDSAQWKVAHILIAIPKGADPEAIQEIEQSANEAYQALENNPAQFAQWVKTMSADKLSLADEGILPWIKAGQTEFDPALTTLSKPEQISKPIKTSHGFEIFKLVAYKPAQLKPLASVKMQIAEQLQNEEAQANYSKALEQLTDLSFQTSDSLEPVANALNIKLETSEPFSQFGGNNELTKNKEVIKTAFSHDVKELGNNSEPVQLDNDNVVVLRVNKHFPATKQPLAEVQAEIINRLAKEKAEVKAEQWGKEFIATKQIGNEKASTAISVNGKALKWNEISEASRETENTESAINDAAFALAEPSHQQGIKLANGDYVIVNLKKINNGSYKSLDKEQQASLAQQLESNFGLMDYQLYINNLIKNAQIKQG